MFAPHQERAARELLRVGKPVGSIALANWTPDGFVGRLFEVISAHVPPPAGLRSPMEWGTEPRLVELFGPRARDIRTQRKTYTFRYRTAEHWIVVFRAWFGPIHKAFAALDEEGQRAFHAALRALLERPRDRSGPCPARPAPSQ